MEAMERLKMHYDFAKTIIPENQIVGIFLRGSQNYGLEGPNSDVDSLCLVVPSVREIAKMERPLAKELTEGDDGGHVTFMDIREFINQIRKQNPNILEILFTKYAIRNPDFAMNWYKLYNEREKLARYRPYAALNTMVCMANAELGRMKKHGYKGKGLALILRMEKMMSDYMTGKKFEDCLYVGDYGDIRKIKLGLEPVTSVEGMYMAEVSVHCMKKWYEQYCNQNSDLSVGSAEALLRRTQYQFCVDHWRWELGEDEN